MQDFVHQQYPSVSLIVGFPKLLLVLKGAKGL